MKSDGKMVSIIHLELSIHGVCDSVYTRLASVRHTSLITKEEDKLWSLGIFGCDNPRSLQCTIFFYFGKMFCIRGEEEMWKPGPSQFKRSFNPDCITYEEHGSKHYSGRASDLHFENKEVPCPPIPSLISRCLVFLMDLYLAKLPLYTFEKDILLFFFDPNRKLQVTLERLGMKRLP